MSYTASERFDQKQRRMKSMRRRNARGYTYPASRCEDLDKPYCRAREKQAFRVMLLTLLY